MNMYIILIVIVVISLASAIYFYKPRSTKVGEMYRPKEPHYIVADDCPSCQTNSTEHYQPQEEQSDVVVDRLVFANRNSQLRAMGDPIRGDLAIVPSAPGWFTPSVSPQIDLQKGAMNMLGGPNANTQQMKTLFALSTAGALPTSELPFNSVSGTTYAQLGNRNQDLTVTSFP